MCECVCVWQCQGIVEGEEKMKRKRWEALGERFTSKQSESVRDSGSRQFTFTYKLDLVVSVDHIRQWVMK